MTHGAFGKTYDAIIVGARCAGAATAMLLARRGARALVIDHSQPGTDIMSTHALMRGAVLQLRKWGLLDAVIATGAPAIRRTTFCYGSETTDIELKAEQGGDAVYAPRRFLLDSILAEAAASAGAELRYGTGLAGLLYDNTGRVQGARLKLPSGAVEEVRAPLVIGADGRRSAVARHVGARITRRARHSIACVYTYVEGLPNRGYRWHFTPGGAGGVIPTNDGLSCVFVAVPPDIHSEARAVAGSRWRYLIDRHLPVLAEELTGAVAVSTPITFPGLPGWFRESAGPGWALVGDAGYFRDPITAHGITDAFRDAGILADAVMDGQVARYPALRDALSSEFFELTGKLASFAWSIDEVKSLHVALNRVMKANQQWIAGMENALPDAA